MQRKRAVGKFHETIFQRSESDCTVFVRRFCRNFVAFTYYAHSHTCKKHILFVQAAIVWVLMRARTIIMSISLFFRINMTLLKIRDITSAKSAKIRRFYSVRGSPRRCFDFFFLLKIATIANWCFRHRLSATR